MATIYLHPTGNGLGDNTLVLEPREALVYPFDFGNDWKELGMGMFFSYCGLSGNNSPWSTEVTTSYTSSLLNSFYFGLTNYNNPFPSDKANYYMGAFTQQGFANSNYLARTSSDIDAIGYTLFLSGIKTGAAGASQVKFSDRTAMNLPTGYAGFLGIKLASSFDTGSANGKQITGGMRVYSSPSEFPVYSISNLEKEIVNGTYGYNGVIANAYWTTDGFSGSPILPRPNAILIYSPFISNKLRIHSLLLTKLS
jgi:hypothetical protein